MGSCSYDRDVYSSSSYDSWGASSYSASKFKSEVLDENLKPNGKKIVSNSKNPIILVLDVTGSNINFARLVYDKLPMFYGQIEQKGYLNDFDLCICAVGDAKCDSYPIQIGSPSKGLEIDSWLEKIVLEGGGGGNVTESYELMAHYLLNNTEFRSDATPFLFFIADEKPYDYVSKDEASRIGCPIERDYSPWSKLNEKFNDNVYVMLNKYCGNSFRNDITDAWKNILPSEHTVRIPEEKAIIDLLLGIIALRTKELEIYALDMKTRGQTINRIEGVISSLKALAEVNSNALVNVENMDSMSLKLKHTNKGRRI